MVFSKKDWVGPTSSALLLIFMNLRSQLAKKMLLWEKQGNSLIDGNKWAFKLGPIKVEVAGVYLKDSSKTDPQLLSSCSSNGKNQVSSPPLPALGLQLPSVCQSKSKLVLSKIPKSYNKWH